MDNPSTQPGILTTTAASLSSAPAVAESSPEKTVREYLNWYSTHYDKLPTNLVKYPTSHDPSGYYAVDFHATESWLTSVRESGLLSEGYLQHWRSYFKQYADTMRLHHQNDGPAPGFEYDFLMLSQEADTKLTELQAGIFTTRLVSGTSATVAALGPQHDGWREGMTFELTKSATGQWQIETMSIPDNLIQ